MSDHKAEAEAIMDNLAAPASDPHGAALVHATLYLAEQQRIANLQTERTYLQNELAREPQNHPKLRRLLRADGRIQADLGLMEVGL